MGSVMNSVGLLVGFPRFPASSEEYEQAGQQSKGLYTRTALNIVVKRFCKDNVELTIQDL